MATTKKKTPLKKVAKTKTSVKKTTKKTEELSYYMKRKLRLEAEARAEERRKKKLAKAAAEKRAAKKADAPKEEKIKKTKKEVKLVVKSTVEKAVTKTVRQKKVLPQVDIELEEDQQPIVVVNTAKNIYLNNRDLLAEVKISKEKGVMSPKLARMLQMLCAKYAKKGNFVNYSYNEDMQAYAMMMLVRTWDGFKPEVSNNAFAWYTQCVKNSFIQYLNQEKRQRIIRDELLIDQGMAPSYGFGEKDDADTHTVDDEEDYHAHKSTAKKLEDLPSERPDDDTDLPEDSPQQ